jgi:CRISPR-associated protein Csb3
MTFRVAVDPTNPGQYFACCGLLELARRLDTDVEACFGDGWFEVSTSMPLAQLIQALASAPLLWRGEIGRGTPFEVGPPFHVRLDWWTDRRAGGVNLKVWAGQMSGYRIAQAMQATLVRPEFQDEHLLDRGCIAYDAEGKKTEPFYFDARRGASAHPLDMGFSTNPLDMKSLAYPAVELLCLIGLQRHRPRPTADRLVFEYHTWARPLSARIVPCVVAGALVESGAERYRFENGFRTDQKKHKAFMPSTKLGRTE